MKRFLSALLLLPALALAATTTPVQLLSPTGSTVGQAIVSNGPSSAPTWQAVPLTGVTGVLPIANGGTNASTAAAALSNLGGAALTGAAFTGQVTISIPSAENRFILNSSAGQLRSIAYTSGNLRRWQMSADSTAEGGSNAGSDFNIFSYNDAGLLMATPLKIVRSTGVTTFSTRPVFGSATPWDSANLASPASTTGNLGQFASTTSAQLATVISNETGSGALVFGTSPTIGTATINTPTISGGTVNNAVIGGTTPAAGTFTTISTTAMSKVKATTTNAQSIPNNAFTTVINWTTTQNQGSNFVAATGVYTAPVTGDYDVRAGVRYAAATGVTGGTQILIAVAVNGTVVYQTGMVHQSTASFASQAAGSWIVSATAGDLITIRVFQNSGVSMTLDGVAAANYVQITQLP